MTIFGQGQLSRSFTVKYLIIDTNTSYFVLIGRKTLNELGAIVSTLHLKMIFLTLTGQIITVKLDQKQTRQCYAKNLKMAPYPPIREPSRPHPTVGGSSQVMSVGEVSLIQTLTVYEASLGDHEGVFNIEPRDDTVDKGLKPIKELIKL